MRLGSLARVGASLLFLLPAAGSAQTPDAAARAGSFTAPGAEPTVAGPNAACLARLAQARNDLLRAGFAPTTDGDTGRWLQSYESSDGILVLSLQMRTSADGAQTGFHLAIDARPSRKLASTPWRFHRQRLCCDDHQDWEDNLIEYEWRRRAHGREAVITVVQFGETVRTERARAERAWFARIARQAADDCLAAKRVP
jgi:hypothetical protein